MSKGFASNYRIVLLAVLVFACFAVMAVRLVFLHVIDRDELVRFTDKARRQIIVERARRGDILDAHGDVLATSRSMIVLGADPQSLRPEDEAKWPQLAELVGLPLAELRRLLTAKTRPASAETAAAESAPAPGRDVRWVKLSDEITESAYDRITALGIKGVYGNRTYRRAYPHNQLAAHLIGYVNREDAPAAGLESYADFYLRGQDGWRESEKDGRQRELAQFRSREVPAINGCSVVLSLDSVIQHIVEVELDAIAKTFTPRKATVIVSDARTGFILALGNYPSYNLNEFNKAPLEVQRNFAVTDQFDPGSTFKIVAASGALNENLVSLGTRFDCSAEHADYNGRRLRLVADDHHWDHALSVAEIISHSSNRGAARLAMQLGDRRFYDYAVKFGFGRATGFPFGGEINGDLHPPEKWSGIDITRIPAGYSVSATPMQIHCAMAVIAAGGEMLKPQIVREVRDPAGETIYRFAPVVKQRVVTARTAEQMAVALMGVASKEGTAPEAAIPGYMVAGKTGTAQKLINGRYSDRNHIGSFVGFFPANSPRVVISVIVDDGRVPGGGNAYGKVVAAPGFRRIGEKLIQYLDIPPAAAATRPLLVMGGGSL